MSSRTGAHEILERLTSSQARLGGLAHFVPGVVLSFFVHGFGALLAGALGIMDVSQPPGPPVARVEIAAAPTPAPTAPPPAPVVTPPPKVEPKEEPKKKPEEKPKEKVRKARARETEAAPTPEEPPEIRGGLSDSLSTSDKTGGAPAVAQGNSSEVAVDPSNGDLPPPAPVPIGTNPDVVDYDAVAVEEVFADSSADCSGAIPQLDLTPDAINAGVTSGELVFQVFIDEKGRVKQPKLVQGTGYDIDKVALEALGKMSCSPAKADGQPTVVRKEIRFKVVDF